MVGVCVCVCTHSPVRCPPCSLPPVPQEPTSDLEAISGVSTNPYDDFAFETDTTGEEDEADGSDKSGNDQLPQSKEELPAEDETAAQDTSEEPLPTASGDEPGDPGTASLPQVNEPLPTSSVDEHGAPASSIVPVVYGARLFNPDDLETFEGCLGPPDLVKDTFVPVYVSNVNSPTDFWVSL